ncbi:MAG: glycosyltransferase, partial [Pseudomonadota bacterium]
PVTLIEAMAAGKPIIATDVGGVRDLLGPVDNKDRDGYKLAQNGILIPSGQEEVLAEALMFLSENTDLSGRMTKNAHAFVLERYSRERLVKDLEALYRGLLAP